MLRALFLIQPGNILSKFYVSVMHNIRYRYLYLCLFVLFRGKLYWACKINTTKSYAIKSSALDGSKIETLIIANETARSLSIDFSTERLYFVYVENAKIAYFDLKTKTVSILFYYIFILFFVFVWAFQINPMKIFRFCFSSMRCCQMVLTKKSKVSRFTRMIFTSRNRMTVRFDVVIRISVSRAQY